MSGINWDVAQAQAAQQATNYSKRLHPDPAEYYVSYNAYQAGFMESAAERESLRVINARLQKELDALKSGTPLIVKGPLKVEPLPPGPINWQPAPAAVTQQPFPNPSLASLM